MISVILQDADTGKMICDRAFPMPFRMPAVPSKGDEFYYGDRIYKVSRVMWTVDPEYLLKNKDEVVVTLDLSPLEEGDEVETDWYNRGREIPLNRGVQGK